MKFTVFSFTIFAFSFCASGMHGSPRYGATNYAGARRLTLDPITEMIPHNNASIEFSSPKRPSAIDVSKSFCATNEAGSPKFRASPNGGANPRRGSVLPDSVLPLLPPPTPLLPTQSCRNGETKIRESEFAARNFINPVNFTPNVDAQGAAANRLLERKQSAMHLSPYPAGPYYNATPTAEFHPPTLVCTPAGGHLEITPAGVVDYTELSQIEAAAARRTASMAPIAKKAMPKLAAKNSNDVLDDSLAFTNPLLADFDDEEGIEMNGVQGSSLDKLKQATNAKKGVVDPFKGATLLTTDEQEMARILNKLKEDHIRHNLKDEIARKEERRRHKHEMRCLIGLIMIIVLGIGGVVTAVVYYTV